MIRIQNIPLPVGGDLELLRRRAAKALGVRPGALEDLILVRQSIDARKKQDVHYVYTVDVSLKSGEEQAVERAGKKNIALVTPKPYVFPEVKRRSGTMPVVVGMGPAGLFAALFLARNGIPCVVLERGEDVDARTAKVEGFWAGGALDPASNVQFGEGGAGTFSDGKLTTGTHDPRISAVMDALVGAGAPADVKWSHKPHIGTGEAHPPGAHRPGVRRALRPSAHRSGDRGRDAHRRARGGPPGGVPPGLRRPGAGPGTLRPGHLCHAP